MYRLCAYMTAISKYLTQTGRKEWLSALPKLVDGLNSRPLPQLLNESPKSVKLSQTTQIFQHRFGKVLAAAKSPHPKFQLGQLVRIRLKQSSAFSKSYQVQWTHTLYVITRISSVPPTLMYTIREAGRGGRVIAGRFYSGMELFAPSRSCCCMLLCAALYGFLCTYIYTCCVYNSSSNSSSFCCTFPSYAEQLLPAFLPPPDDATTAEETAEEAANTVPAAPAPTTNSSTNNGI